MNTHYAIHTKIRPLAFACLLSTVLYPAAILSLSGETLFTYDMAGSDIDSQLKSPASINGIVVSNITTNNLTAGTVTAGTKALTTAPAKSQSTYNFTTAYEQASWISFTVTAATGYSLSLDSFSVRAASGSANDPGTPDTTVRAFYMLSSVTGFDSESSSVLLTDGNNATLPLRKDGLKLYSVTLSDARFQNITETVEFRIYIQCSGTTQTIVFDDISLAGTLTAIPEASTITLITGVAGLLFAALFSRRTR
ncbi:MAG: hypothetical protein LBK99_06600 [Opitutaceae bacterium]|jgi:hypothetical protein|nr:hypothetical protein [Opitutaceae bacterium]